MDNEKDLPKPEAELPKPETDLPSPEKEITGGNTNPATPPSNNQGVSSSSPEKTKSKGGKLKWIFLSLIIIGVVLVLSGGGYFFLNQSSNSQPTPTPEAVACTQEAMLCPDGITYVSRQGPKCEFAKCPDVSPEASQGANMEMSPKPNVPSSSTSGNLQ